VAAASPGEETTQTKRKRAGRNKVGGQVGGKMMEMANIVQKVDEDLGLQKLLWFGSLLGGLVLLLYT
jgi:hypothetical protein